MQASAHQGLVSISQDQRVMVEQPAHYSTVYDSTAQISCSWFHPQERLQDNILEHLSHHQAP